MKILKYSVAAAAVMSIAAPLAFAQPLTNFGLRQHQPQAAAPAAEAPILADRSAQMAGELRRLIEMAKRYNAAHPVFLRDLEMLAEHYDSGAPQVQPAVQPPVQPQPQVQPPVQPQPQVQPPVQRPQPVQPQPQPQPQPVQPQPQPVVDPPAPEQQLTPEERRRLRRQQRREQQRQQQQQENPQTAPTDGTAPTAEANGGRNQRPVVLRDSFRDGEFANNPTWVARQGDWTVDNRYGLRSLSTIMGAQAEITPQDLVQALATGQGPAAQPAARQAGALIEAPVAIDNAFILQMRLADHRGEGATHLIMHQQGERWLGYRLEIRGGMSPEIVLTRRGSSGYTDLAKAPAPMLTQNPAQAATTAATPHNLTWARRPNGAMVVQIDGQELIKVRDRGFRDGWTGFAIFNAGSDVSFRRVLIRDWD